MPSKIDYSNVSATAADLLDNYGTHGARREALVRKISATSQAKREFWKKVIADLDSPLDQS